MVISIWLIYLRRTKVVFCRLVSPLAMVFALIEVTITKGFTQQSTCTVFKLLTISNENRTSYLPTVSKMCLWRDCDCAEAWWCGESGTRSLGLSDPTPPTVYYNIKHLGSLPATRLPLPYYLAPSRAQGSPPMGCPWVAFLCWYIIVQLSACVEKPHPLYKGT